MKGDLFITNIPENNNLKFKGSRISEPPDRIDFNLSQGLENLTVSRFDNRFQGFPLFFTRQCSSTMDLSFLLHQRNEFPVWSSVIAEQQLQGRGQFGRTWISRSGNLYAAIRIPQSAVLSSISPLVTALSVNKALKKHGIHSEFKWPNDILVHRKKIGGILVEERLDVVIAGIGLNLIHSPSMDDMRNPNGLAAGCLKESGFSLKPLEIWSDIFNEIKELWSFYETENNLQTLIRDLEEIMAFTGDDVVFTPPNGPEFSAVISGLTETGCIRLKTTDGMKTFSSGSFFPVVH